MRVQIPAYTDRWMMGDRYGVVVKTGKTKHADIDGNQPTVFTVKLDKSGKTIKVYADDCEVI